MKKDRENQRRSTCNVAVQFFLREHSPRTSSTVVRGQVQGTHVGGHARTRYRVGHGLRLPMRKNIDVETLRYAVRFVA